jgi:hypothetical protein
MVDSIRGTIHGTLVGVGLDIVITDIMVDIIMATIIIMDMVAVIMVDMDTHRINATMAVADQRLMVMYREGITLPIILHPALADIRHHRTRDRLPTVAALTTLVADRTDTLCLLPTTVLKVTVHQLILEEQADILNLQALLIMHQCQVLINGRLEILNL